MTIIFLFGQNSYGSRQKLNEIIERYQAVHKKGINLKIFTPRETSFSELENLLRETSIFREKKLIVMEDFFSDQNFKDDFLVHAKKFPDFLEKSDDILVFYESGKVLKKDDFSAFLKKKAKCQEFNPPEEADLRKWVKKRAEFFGKKFSGEALEKIINYVGNDLWRMENEIRKLAGYRKEKNIETSDVEDMVRSKIDSDVFKTIEAIAAKNKKNALKLLHAHLEKGDAPFYLFSMINFQFRNLLVIKDAIDRGFSPYGSMGIHPYVVKKSLYLLDKFEFAELKKIYRRLFRIDLDMKTGKIKPELAMDLLISRL